MTGIARRDPATTQGSRAMMVAVARRLAVDGDRGGDVFGGAILNERSFEDGDDAAALPIHASNPKPCASERRVTLHLTSNACESTVRLPDAAGAADCVRFLDCDA